MNRFYRKVGKRLFDLAMTLPMAVLLLPLIATAAILVRLTLGSPVVFRQPRGGHQGRHFVIWKFRTMRDACDADGEPLSDGLRLTRFGKLLRSLSLDELPQLWNVVRGDMSIVGPRPLRIEYLDRYTPQQARRHEVTPGITGWAQVNGRNAISWEEKFELDVWYVDHQSFALDLSILWRTFVEVLSRKGVSSDDHATMPFFTGTKTPAERSP